jgi:hypothetical protein
MWRRASPSPSAGVLTRSCSASPAKKKMAGIGHPLPPQRCSTVAGWRRTLLPPSRGPAPSGGRGGGGARRTRRRRGRGLPLPERNGGRVHAAARAPAGGRASSNGRALSLRRAAARAASGGVTRRAPGFGLSLSMCVCHAASG